MFLDHELTVSATVDPEEILWENLGTKGSAMVKQLLLYSFTLLLVCVAFAFIVCIEAGRRAIESHRPFKQCPNVPILKEDAYLDFVNPQLTIGLMHCYCRQLYDNKPWTLFDLNFNQFRVDEEAPEIGNLCSSFVGFHILQEFVWVM